MRCAETAEQFFKPGDCIHSCSPFYCWTLPPTSSTRAMGGPRFKMSADTISLVVYVVQVTEDVIEGRVDITYTRAVLLLVENKLLWAWESQIDAWPLNDR